MTINETTDKIRALIRGEAANENIFPILYSHGADYLISLLPNEHIPDRYRVERSLNKLAVKERYVACRGFFEKADFPYAVIKGAVLSVGAYGDPFIRRSGDVDILIRRSDADRLKGLLTSLGFIQGRVTESEIEPFSRKEILFQTSMSHQTAPYIKQTQNKLCPFVNLDVNTNVMWGESREKADMDLILSYREECELFGTRFFKLSCEMEFISLCLHHYKDMNSLYLLAGGSLKLGLLCDIYFYLKSTCPSPQKIKELSEKLNVGKYVYYCIYHASSFFADGALEDYLGALDCLKDTSLLNSFGLTASERKEWDLELSERLFRNDVPSYINSRLSDTEKEKIKLNRELM